MLRFLIGNNVVLGLENILGEHGALGNPVGQSSGRAGRGNPQSPGRKNHRVPEKEATGIRESWKLRPTSRDSGRPLSLPHDQGQLIPLSRGIAAGAELAIGIHKAAHGRILLHSRRDDNFLAGRCYALCLHFPLPLDLFKLRERGGASILKRHAKVRGGRRSHPTILALQLKLVEARVHVHTNPVRVGICILLGNGAGIAPKIAHIVRDHRAENLLI